MSRAVPTLAVFAGLLLVVGCSSEDTRPNTNMKVPDIPPANRGVTGGEKIPSPKK